MTPRFAGALDNVISKQTLAETEDINLRGLVRAQIEHDHLGFRFDGLFGFIDETVAAANTR